MLGIAICVLIVVYMTHRINERRRLFDHDGVTTCGHITKMDTYCFSDRHSSWRTVYYKYQADGRTYEGHDDVDCDITFKDAAKVIYLPSAPQKSKLKHGPNHDCQLPIMEPLRDFRDNPIDLNNIGH